MLDHTLTLTTEICKKRSLIIYIIIIYYYYLFNDGFCIINFLFKSLFININYINKETSFF